MSTLASEVDDYLDEEVVDKEGAPIGTLACYWEGAGGKVVFFGIKLTDQDEVRIVPVRGAEVNERHSCIQVCFELDDIADAPAYDCDYDLDDTLERAVHEHFNLEQPQRHGALKYFSGHTSKG